MAMKNMKLSPEKAHEMTMPMKSDAPAYPYGLCIRLDEAGLKKLGVKELPKVGSKMTLKAIVEVQSVGSYESQQSESRNMELQITDMEISGAKREVGTEKLYDKK